MKESVAIAKVADAKKGISTARSKKSTHRTQNESERKIGGGCCYCMDAELWYGIADSDDCAIHCWSEALM